MNYFYLFLGALFICSCSESPQKTLNTDAKEKAPVIQKFNWTSSGNFIIAESNGITLVPDTVPYQNGAIYIVYIETNAHLEWYYTHRFYNKVADIEKNVPPVVLAKIKRHLREAGTKTIDNVFITERSAEYRLPPEGQMYSVFGVNKQNGKQDRYYFTPAGDYINPIP